MAQTPAKGRKPRTTQAKTADPVITPETVTDAEVVESASVDTSDDVTVPAPDETPPMQGDPVTPPADPAPPPPEKPKTERRGGFVPLVLGGVIAAGLGYGVAYLQSSQDRINQATIDATQADAIAKLQSDLAATEGLSAKVENLTAAQADLSASIAAIPDSIAPQIADLTARIDAVERAPSADGTLSETALAAYESDIAALRDELATQRENMAAVAADAQAQLNAARDQAAQITQNSTETAERAAARAALAQVVAAMESGAPYDAALPELATIAADPLPYALTGPAPDGIPTLAALQAAYPDAARAALASARRSGEAGENNTGLTAFLRTQFDIRSVTPSEGDSVDAILSRGEAALQQGQLADAIGLIETLPDSARAELADWAAQAKTRADALAAIETLSTTLNVN